MMHDTEDRLESTPFGAHYFKSDAAVGVTNEKGTCEGIIFCEFCGLVAFYAASLDVRDSHNPSEIF